MEGGDVVVTAGKAVCGSGEGLVYGCVDARTVYCAVYEWRIGLDEVLLTGNTPQSIR